MSNIYAYQNSLDKYTNLLDAYKNSVENQLSTNQLKELNDQVNLQTKQSLGLGAGLPLSLSVGTAFLKTKGSKALMRKLGKKLGLDDEDLEEVMSKDPKESMANLIDKYGSRKINRLLGREPRAEADEPEVSDIADEPFDTETFNVEFPSLLEAPGEVQRISRYGDILEAPIRQRQPLLEDEPEYFDTESLEGDLMETAFPSVSSETVTFPRIEGTEMMPQSNLEDVLAEIGGDVGADVGEIGESVGEGIGESVGEGIGEDVVEGAIEETGLALDSTGIGAPLGIGLAVIGGILSFLPFFGHHHHHPPPQPPPKNYTVPSLQVGV